MSTDNPVAPRNLIAAAVVAAEDLRDRINGPAEKTTADPGAPFAPERVAVRDRAAVVTQALLQMIAPAAPEYLRPHVEALLGDEFSEVQRQAIADRSLPDA